MSLKRASVLPGVRGTEHESWLICVGHHRESDLLEECNWDEAYDRMLKVDPEGADFEVLRFGHFAVGWVEEMVVRPGSKCHEEAQDIHNALDAYPVLNEERFYEAECEEAGLNDSGDETEEDDDDSESAS